MKKKGLTLIELIITIGLFSLMLNILVIIIIKLNKMYRENEYIKDLYTKVNIIGNSIKKTASISNKVQIGNYTQKLDLVFEDEENKKIKYSLYKEDTTEKFKKYYIIYKDGRKKEFLIPKEIQYKLKIEDSSVYKIYTVELYVYNLKYKRNQNNKYLVFKVSMIEKKD